MIVCFFFTGSAIHCVFLCARLSVLLLLHLLFILLVRLELAYPRASSLRWLSLPPHILSFRSFLTPPQTMRYTQQLKQIHARGHHNASVRTGDCGKATEGRGAHVASWIRCAGRLRDSSPPLCFSATIDYTPSEYAAHARGRAWA